MGKINEMTAIKNRETRGAILRALSTGGMRPISKKSLENALVSIATDIYPHLTYLSDKKYIRIIGADSNSILNTGDTVELTAHGIDLMEGSIPDDPGIII
ncbi:MAG: hypothetical protein FWF10_08090 [Clostridiales bacterium]|nr:hypothetical protein [Clostridiales bacterium]